MELKDIKKPKTYTMREIAEFMGISYHAMFRLVKSGKIKGVNVATTGKRPIYAFTAEDVQEYYNSIGKRDPERDPEAPVQ